MNVKIWIMTGFHMFVVIFLQTDQNAATEMDQADADE
jgi:hypothetical protein